MVVLGMVQFGWGEATDEPSSLRFDALKPAREDARPTEFGFGQHAVTSAAAAYSEFFNAR